MPSSILVMTFTERAAVEMRSRIEIGLGSYLGELWVGTFHSVAQTLLREDGWRIGVPPSFRILAGADRWIQMRELLWELGDPGPGRRRAAGRPGQSAAAASREAEAGADRHATTGGLGADL